MNLSLSSNGIIESGSAMTLHCTENLHSCGARAIADNTAVCPANHLAITAVMANATDIHGDYIIYN